MFRQRLSLCIARIVCVSACALLATASGAAVDSRRSAPAPLMPIPDAAAQYRARDLVRETFRREFAAQEAAERRSLANKLIHHAVETKGDPAARYVLLCEARDVAAGAGDISAACRAIGLLRRQFEVDELTLTTSALTTSANLTLPGPGHAAVARAALAAVTRAVRADDYDAAFRLMNLATSAANKSRDADLARHVAERARELRSLKTDFDSLQAALDKLKEDPNDPDANTLVGRYRCLVKSDFETSLPYLCKSSDAPLRLIAERASAERAEWAVAREPDAPIDAFELASLWWDLADAYSGLARLSLRTHAARLYRDALPKLTGLHRAAAESRLERADEEAMREMNLAPGLVVEMFGTIAFVNPLAARIDPQVNFDWNDDAPHENVPKDNFSIRWTGLLRTTASGRYTFTALANTGTRIYLNDRLVLDAPNLTRNRNGIKFTMDLPAGLHALKVEFWDTTGLARMKLLWQPPGSAKEMPVSASHFYHDALIY